MDNKISNAIALLRYIIMANVVKIKMFGLIIICLITFAQCDIMLDDMLIKGGVVDKYYTWKNVGDGLTIPYKVEIPKSSLAIKNALNDLATRSLLKFTIRTNESDYVVFRRIDKGCWSWVGFQGGPQTINLGDGCLTTSIIQHEVFHALGIFHEQSREDRDKYITIHYENIESGKSHNFDKHVSKTFGIPYDYSSIMHYPEFAFSKNDLPTISRKDGKDIVTSPQATNYDIALLDALYDSRTPTFQPTYNPSLKRQCYDYQNKKLCRRSNCRWTKRSRRCRYPCKDYIKKINCMKNNCRWRRNRCRRH